MDSKSLVESESIKSDTLICTDSDIIQLDGNCSVVSSSDSNYGSSKVVAAAHLPVIATYNVRFFFPEGTEHKNRHFRAGHTTRIL